jgi:hydroxyacylglutathione hydrolase
MDHAGGNSEFLSAFHGKIEIVGSSRDNVEACTRVVANKESFYLSNIKITCLLTPGHTMGHICYYAEHKEERIVFTGDCLFVGGAGKFFEGSGEDMYFSLYEQLGQLPPDTKVFCGHEYTLSNYRFGLSIDEGNQDLVEANQIALIKRAAGEATVPSTIEIELKTNPFLRANNELLRMRFGDASTPVADILSAIREAKNNFK